MKLIDEVRAAFKGVPHLEVLGEKIAAALGEADPDVVKEMLDEEESDLKEQLRVARQDLEGLLILIGDVGLGIRTLSELWQKARDVQVDNDLPHIHGLR